VIRLVEPELVTGTRVDPIRIARSLPSYGEQRLFTSIHRNMNLADALAQGVPRNSRPAVAWPAGSALGEAVRIGAPLLVNDGPDSDVGATMAAAHRTRE
jgi:hypothetical protein